MVHEEWHPLDSLHSVPDFALCTDGMSVQNVADKGGAQSPPHTRAAKIIHCGFSAKRSGHISGRHAD
jgi:hypothetical protein